MPLNPLKSLFSRKSTADGAEEKLSPDSPCYAYAFPSPYKRPRILVLVDKVSTPYFLYFHYILLRLHNTESLAFFVLESAEVNQWTQQKSQEAFVEQVIADTQPTLVIFSQYEQPYADVLPALFKAHNASVVCHVCQEGSTQAAQRQILEQADLLYAASPYLGDRLSTQFPNKTIFSAQATPYLDCLVSEYQPKQRAITIGCASSSADQEDLDAIAADIARILTDYPQAQFEVLGIPSMPDVLLPFGTRVRVRNEAANYDIFLSELKQLGWTVGLLPQQDTEANHSQLPSQYLAYTACGIPTIASNSAVYNQFENDSVESEQKILLTQPDQWYDSIKRLIDSEAQCSTIVANAQTYCQQNFSLEVVEAQIKELIALA